MSGTNATRELIEYGPAIILVEPQLGENIGTAARAMANFGLSELRIVNPREGWPNEKAKAAASRADHVIRQARVFETVDDAVADLAFVYATSARERTMAKPVVGPVEAAQTMARHKASGAQVGILFGRERWGLTNDEILMADEIVTLPVNPAFASLNIAQAVLIIAYEWMQHGMSDAGVKPYDWADGTGPATKDELRYFFEHFDNLLDACNHYFPPDKRPHMQMNLHALLQRAQFSGQETQTMRGVLASLEKALCGVRPVKRDYLRFLENGDPNPDYAARVAAEKIAADEARETARLAAEEHARKMDESGDKDA